jgi:hypothetical protein
MGKYSGKPYSNFKSTGTSFEWLRFAEVTRVDYFRQELDIRYLDADNMVTRVPFISPGYYPGGSMGGMPEIGSVALVGYTKQTSGSGFPIVLGFLPRNLLFSYNMEPFNLQDNLTDTFSSVFLKRRLKNWKLYPGEFLISSIDGSDLRVDKGIFLQNSAMNEIYMDPHSQIISMLSINQVMNSKAGRMNFGLIHRNELLNSAEYASKFNPAAQYLADGRLFYRTNNAQKHLNFDYGVTSLDTPGTIGYTEFRLDIKELADDTLDVTEESSGVNQAPSVYASGSEDDPTVTYPLVTFSLGTLVGNDSLTRDGRNKYGKVLRPVTFASNDSQTIKGEEEVVDNTAGINGERHQAAAVHVKLPNTRTQLSLTKEGVLELSLDKSSGAHPLGAGRSANIGMAGSLKAVIGAGAADGKSLLLDMLGGAKINIGSETVKNRSLDLFMSNGLNLEILGSDTDKNAFRGRITGNVDIVITGNRTTVVHGDDITLVHGKMEDRVLGKKVDNFINDKSNNYGGSLKENVTYSYQSNIGQGRKVTIAAPDLVSGDTDADKLKILLGNKVTTMLLGNHETSMVAGKHTLDVILGEVSTSIGVGNFKVEAKVGNVSLETLVGNVSISTLAGTMSLEALSISMKALQVNVNAPLVKIGSLPQGGVVNNGAAGHKDYLTGLPLLGSVSVTVNTI